MNHKDQKKAALRRRRESISTFKNGHNGIEFKRVGIVVKALTFSQLNMFLIPDLNHFVQNVVGTSIDVITKHSLPPCARTDFVVREWIAIKNQYDVMIATDLETCLASLESTAKTIIFYVFDIDFVDRLDMMYFDLTRCFVDKRIKIITRSLEYKSLIETEFPGTSANVVEDFDIQKLLEGVQ